MAKLLKRLRGFAERNRGAVWTKARDEALVRLWLKPSLRAVLRPVMPKRQPQAWVFMGGCYNSGTTILREMLGAHPEVATLPREGVVMTDAFPALEAGGWQRMWWRNADKVAAVAADPARVAARAQADWAPWWRRGAKVYLEKSIAHGAWMPALEQGFENARFIGVIRNGYCACEGIRRRAKPSGAAAAELGREDYPLAEVGRQWVHANEVLLRDREALGQYHEIRYEAFAEAPADTLRALFRFVGVDDSVVEDLGGGHLRVAGRDFTVANQNAASLARLSAQDLAEITPVIGPMLDQLGYDREGGAA